MAAGTSAVLLLIGSGVAGVVALSSGDDAKPGVITAVGTASTGDEGGSSAATIDGNAPELPPGDSVAVPARTSKELDPAVSRKRPGEVARSTAKAEPSPVTTAETEILPARPVITTRTDTETREVPFSTQTVSDPDLPSGSREVQTPGVAGEQTLRYLVTLTDGKQTGRRLLDSTVTRPPQQQVVAVGAKTDRCDGAPLGLCLPIGRDMTTCGGGHHWRGERDENDQAEDGGQISLGDNGISVLGSEQNPDGGWGC
jgi:hypothetical protein